MALSLFGDASRLAQTVKFLAISDDAIELVIPQDQFKRFYSSPHG